MKNSEAVRCEICGKKLKDRINFYTLFGQKACPGECMVKLLKEKNKENKIINLTPHPVNIIDGPTFQSEGSVRLETVITPCEDIAGIKTQKTEFKNPVGLPAREDGVFLIVSQLVQSSCDRDDLLVPADVVRNDKGQIIGCKALGRK